MDKYPVQQKFPVHRVMKFKLYQLLTGQLVTRRDLMTAGAAGATGVAVDHMFGFAMSSKTVKKLAESILPKEMIINAEKFKKSIDPLGHYVYLTPEKLGGGTHAVDMYSGKTLAWISYWNYGDSCPISHHLAAYPSPDPYKAFEFVNSTQGGMNVKLYEIPSQISEHGMLGEWGQGNHLYRVKYEKGSMSLAEDISYTTGIGLGVHTTIYPDAKGFAAADGQKDICAFFNRPNEGEHTRVLAAYRADWIGNEQGDNLEENWSKGGTLRIEKLVQPQEIGKFDLQGSKGNKIDWEMVPMAENLVYTGKLWGTTKGSQKGLTGLDAVVHHPGNRYSALIVRMLSASVILDRQNWEPICCLHNPEGSADNLPVKKVCSNPDIWEVKFDDIKCVGHEAGFSPSGKNYAMMNNIKQNNMAIFDTSAPDPREWKRITFVKDPEWYPAVESPSPFHLAYSMDGSKMFVSVLHRKPAKSGCCVVDTTTWKIIKKFPQIGPDCQTMSVSYDGKYVFQIFSGFQRLESGVFIFTQDTLEPLGYMPNFGGHHDCVIVPTKVEQMKNSRCTTL